MNQDWKGNAKSIYTTLGASSHSEGERESNDYYATEPRAVELLTDLVELNDNIWECACGEGHLSEALKNKGFNVWSTDLVDRGYGQTGVDFLRCKVKYYNGDIVTNPPYRYAKEFVEKALAVLNYGSLVCMFLKVTFLESAERRKLFAQFPPKTIYVSSSRLKCAKNGKFEEMGSSAACYCWFIWEKGFHGETTLKWFN